ncbi:lachesin-like isoform X2 [Phymastichus coffea]|uniref:lachesin-like isoform X2 n=1 Tax=Phymastichus coffea TaxID=108790 RepID=UPI00273AA039|nr:lachesin-like isoform X2 [Phymastichus coffea]
MIDREKAFFIVLFTLMIYPGDNLGRATQPEFNEPLTNLTIALGRDAVFTCHVKHLGGYKVGWVKVDTKAIQAIHDHVITHNPRVSVSHHDHTSWNLRISGAQLEDEGQYMCQINTNPMKSQTASLLIQVPPDFIKDQTSSDVNVAEGNDLKLQCRAIGIPIPQITWRREDHKSIIIREPLYEKSTSPNGKVKAEWTGEELYLKKITRDQMGVYLCIASNGVPPGISKRIIVDVFFAPAIQVLNQLVGAPLGTDVRLECFVEASPVLINYWINNNGTMIMSNDRRYDVVTTDIVTANSGPRHKNATKGHHSSHPNFNYKVKMTLTIRNFTGQDIGTYRCAAKNSHGEVESSIRLYVIENALKHKAPSEPAYVESDNELDHNQLQQQSMERPESLDHSVYYGDTRHQQHQHQQHSEHRNRSRSHSHSNSAGGQAKSRGRRPPHHQLAGARATHQSSLLSSASLLVPMLLLCCS